MDIILHISQCFWYWIRGLSNFLDSIYVKSAVPLTVLKRLSILSPDSSDYIQFIKPFAQNVNHSNMSVMLKVNYSASVILFTSHITKKILPHNRQSALYLNPKLMAGVQFMNFCNICSSHLMKLELIIQISVFCRLVSI